MASTQDIAIARENRKKRIVAAKLLSEHEIAIDVSWDQLLNLPEWLYWRESDRRRLVNICGALFIAPLIQLWIDGKKINALHQQLGKGILELVISQKIPIPSDDPIELPNCTVPEMLLIAGATVLINASNKVYQPITNKVFNVKVGQLSKSIALAVVHRACHILRMVDSTTPLSTQQDSSK